jgi:hypothetical protein
MGTDLFRQFNILCKLYQSHYLSDIWGYKSNNLRLAYNIVQAGVGELLSDILGARSLVADLFNG